MNEELDGIEMNDRVVEQIIYSTTTILLVRPVWVGGSVTVRSNTVLCEMKLLRADVFVTLMGRVALIGKNP